MRESVTVRSRRSGWGANAGTEVYVSAGFAENGPIRAIHHRLRERGHAVTVDWTEHGGVEEHERDRRSAVPAGYAERDVGDIVVADAFVLLTEP